MPVSEWDFDLQASEWVWKETAGSLPDLFDVSEDFWRKFEELPDLGDDLESLLESNSCQNEHRNVLRNHDCMWAGTCLSKEHKSFLPSNLPAQSTPPLTPVIRQTNNNNPTNIQTAVIRTSPEKTKRETRRKGIIVQKTVGRSILINSRTRIPEPTRPETPPSLSESEEDEKKSVPVVSVSEVTNQVIIRRTVPQQQPQPQLQTTNLNVQFDHNYDKVRIDDLGVQTPSDSEEEEDEDEEEEEEEEEEVEEEDDCEVDEDAEQERIDEDSEEEIDVVSLNNSNTQNGGVRMRNQANSLPYNPSRELCRELQDTMASAINTNKLYSVNRTINRRIGNGTGRRKRKREESDDDEDENDKKLMYQQQMLLNNRILSNTATTINSNNNEFNNNLTNTTRYTNHRRNWRRSTGTPKKSRFSTDSETDSEKRSLHNNMERMRRIGLRNAFEDLRILIPSLKEVKRAAKVNILKDSADYVRHLTVKERGLAQQVVSLRQEQERLRSRLSKLRRSLAAHR